MPIDEEDDGDIGLTGFDDSIPSSSSAGASTGLTASGSNGVRGLEASWSSSFVTAASHDLSSASMHGAGEAPSPSSSRFLPRQLQQPRSDPQGAGQGATVAKVGISPATSSFNFQKQTSETLAPPAEHRGRNRPSLQDTFDKSRSFSSSSGGSSVGDLSQNTSPVDDESNPIRPIVATSLSTSSGAGSRREGRSPGDRNSARKYASHPSASPAALRSRVDASTFQPSITPRDDSISYRTRDVTDNADTPLLDAPGPRNKGKGKEPIPALVNAVAANRMSVGTGDLASPSPGLLQGMGTFSSPVQSEAHFAAQQGMTGAASRSKTTMPAEGSSSISASEALAWSEDEKQSGKNGKRRSLGRRRGSVAQRAAAAAAAIAAAVDAGEGAGVDVPDRRTSLHMKKSTAGLASGSNSPSTSLKGLEHQPVAQNASSSSSSSTNGPPLMDRKALQRWILSVGVVNFDLDLGPDVEFLYPPLGISKEEKDNIAFSSFPDTSIFDDGFTTFSWRVREVPLDSSESEAPKIGEPSSSSSSSAWKETESPGPSPTVGTSGRNLMPPSPQDSSSQSSMSSAQSPRLKTLSHKTSALLERAKSLQHTRSDSATSGEQHDVAGTITVADASTTVAEVDIKSSLIMKDLEAKTAGGMVLEDKQASRPSTLLPAYPSPSGLRVGGSTSSSYIYGVCFFRQKRDASIRRGYFQKSVVIMSHLPYISLLTELVSKLGPLYFEHGQPMLEAFVQDVMRWPPPEAGMTLHLPALGSVISVALPTGSQFQTDAATNAYIPSATNPNIAVSLLSKRRLTQPGKQTEAEPLLASIPTTPLIDTFREALQDLWLLWECMLLADPILVIGPDPKACSDAVWHLLDLIRPIPFAGDFRPFFHIHDYDCRALVTKNKPQAGTVIGVTNPFFLTACSHWPNVLRVGKPAARRGHHGIKASLGKKSGAPSAPGIAGGMGAGGGGPEHQPGLLSKRKRRASKDRPLLKAMVEAVEKQENIEAANGMLRRYFSDLTERFLQPLNRYVASLVPNLSDVPTSPGEPLRIKPFNTNEFLASLKANGTPLPLKNRNLPTGAALRQSLYVDFLKCPNFSLWLHGKVASAEEDNWARRMKALEVGDVQSFARKNCEIETIDLFSRLREEIRHVDARMAADQSSMGPGSRWKTVEEEGSSGATLSRGGRDGMSSSFTDRMQPISSVTSGSSSATGSTTLSASTPPASSTTTTTMGTYGRALAAKKVRLMEQLDRLADVLPPDLKGSLRLKERSAAAGHQVGGEAPSVVGTTTSAFEGV